MYPPIFSVCAADPTLTGLIGSSPPRLFPAGEAPPNVTRPYITWATIGGSPENYLGDLPDVDSWSIQLDVYAETLTGARSVAEALRNAVEPASHITRFSGDGRDPDTNLYRYSMDVDWWQNREPYST